MIKAAHVKINRLINPESLTAGEIFFTWTVEGTDMQKGFRLSIYEKQLLLYDSEEVLSSKMGFNPDFHARSGGVYTWKLYLLDEQGKQGTAAEGRFGTVLAREDWQAKWINPEPERPDVKNPDKNFRYQVKKLLLKKEPDIPRYPAAYLRKQFTVSEKQIALKDQRLYATAHGLYDVWLNGIKVGDWVLAPGFTQYGDLLNVQAYDVTKYLHVGNNEIVVSLGDGWYRGSMNNERDLNTFGYDLAFLCELRAGDTILTMTEETWQATNEGPLGLNDLQLGERCDANKTLNLASWHSVKVENYGYHNLLGSDCQPIKEQEHFTPRLIQTPNGEKVLDFGQNFAGYVRMELEAKGGEMVVLTHGEALDKENCFTQKNILAITKPEAYQQVFYTCKPGKNVYQPTKCFFGFRYVKVETTLDISPDQFVGIAIYSDMEQTGFFSCGNEKVNQLFNNCLWSMKSNFVGVMTDCPTRERSGYTGDGQVFCPAGLYLMDSYPVYLHWLKSLNRVFLPDGGLKMFAPENRPGGFMDSSHGWCDAIVIIPYLMWKRSGDIRIIQDNYDGAKKWVDFAMRRAAVKTQRAYQKKLPKDLQLYFADQGFCWGEWLEPFETTHTTTILNGIRKYFRGEPEAATAYLAYSATLLAEMAEALGRTEEANIYAQAASGAKDAYRLVYTENGDIQEQIRQCRYVRPMALDLLSEEEKYHAVKKLGALIEKNSDHLNTGFLSTPYLCRMLSDYGEEHKAYDLLLQETRPSWLYEVNKGASTIWETWDGIDEEGNPSDSLNHYSLGAVSGWLLDSVCGIRIQDRMIEIEPKPDRRLGYAEGAYLSPYGMIKSSWKYSGEQLCFTVEIPGNQQAEVRLPDRTKAQCGPGIHQFQMKV